MQASPQLGASRKNRRLPLTSPQILPSPLPSKLDERGDDFVEELVTTPRFNDTLGPNPITIATDFGHMTGRRMSVAPAGPPGQGPGDDLPGAKARKLLGIKTSSGFDDGEADQFSVSTSSLPARSPSPSFFAAVSGIVRRGSTKTPSLTSSNSTWDDEDSNSSASSRSSIEGLGTAPMQRRPSLTNLFGLPTASSKKTSRPRRNSDSHSPTFPQPHYRKARGIDARAAISAGWMRGEDAAASGQPKTPTNANAVPMARSRSLTVDTQAQPEHRLTSVAPKLEPVHSPALTQEFHKPEKKVDEEQSLYELATLEYIFRNSSPSYTAAKRESHRHYPSRQTPSPESWSQASSAGEMPSLTGHESSARSGSPSSLWSCATGSSMSLDVALGRERTTVSSPPMRSKIHDDLPPPPPPLKSVPARNASLTRSPVVHQPKLKRSFDAKQVPLISWPNAPSTHRHAQIIQSGVGEDGAFTRPRRAPAPPTGLKVSTMKNIDDDDDDAEEQELAMLEAQRRSGGAVSGAKRNVCDDIFYVTVDGHDQAEGEEAQEQRSLASSGLVPSYYLHSPSETQFSDDEGEVDDYERATETADDDPRVRSVLMAESPEELRKALALARASSENTVKEEDEGENDDENRKDYSSTDSQGEARSARTPAPLKIRPPYLLHPDRRVKTEGALLPRRSLIVPVDEVAEANLTPGRMDFEGIAHDSTKLAGSIDEALDCIILDLPETRPEMKSPKFHLPPKSPMRPSAHRYVLPIG